MKDKILFDDVNSSSKIFLNSTKVYALDTENTNNNNIESITYCTSLIEVGNKIQNKEFVKNDSNIVNIFTHPLKFWDYIINDGFEKSLLYVYNADYDVENLLPYLIIKYPQLTQKDYNYSLSIDGYYEKDKLIKTEPYTFDFIKSNNSIIGVIITLGVLKEYKSKKVYKSISIYDLAKKTGPGTLASRVKGYLGYDMSKDGLDYNKYRDFGHISYSDLELKYIWEDTYYLKELVYELIYVQGLTQLTASSISINSYKEEFFNVFKENYNNKNHTNYNLFNGYFRTKERVINRINKKDRSKLKAYELKIIEEYNNFIIDNGKEHHNEYILNKLCKKEELFRYVYPELSFELFNRCFKAYKGGITRYNKPCEAGKWINEEGYSFDINSSYPNSMRFKELPYGKGKLYKGKGIKRKNKLYIQSFKVLNPRIRKGYEPIITCNDVIPKPTETWIKEYKGELVIHLTSVELEYFIKAYEYDDINYVSYIEFNSKTGLFDEFIDENYKIKQTSKGALKEIAKLKLNSLYGKFGQNTTSEMRRTFYNEEMNRIDDEIIKDEYGVNKEVKMNQVYLPVAVFTTAYSRLKLVNILNNVNKQKGVNWIYSDTDSVYIIGNKENCIKAMGNEFDIDNTGELGLWKLEKNFIGINIIGIKKYICKIKEDNSIKYKVTLSGIPRKYFNTFESDLSHDENIINIINDKDLNIINSEKYFIRNDTISQDDPYVYYDKECTKRIIGAYKSIKKVKVKNGVVLTYGVYCIKGGRR